MKNSKTFKKKLSEELFALAELNEEMVKKALENEGIDTSETMIVDRSKYMVEFIPEALEELEDKYGSDFDLAKPEIANEARELIERKFHKSLKTPKKWNAYYVLQNCKLPGEIRLVENVKVVPFVEWPCDDYISIVRRLANGSGPVASVMSEKALQTAEKNIRKIFGEKNPTSLIIFNDIEANSEKEVYDITKDFVNQLATILSVLTNTHIEIDVWLFEGKIDGLKVIYPNIFFWHYEPTYTHPKTLEKITPKIIFEAHNNYLVHLALKYENEALGDSEERFKMLKRWSALEFIAEEYSKSIPPILSSGDRKKIVNFIIDEVVKDKSPEILEKIHNTVADMNRKKAKDKVRDLLDWCGYSLRNVTEHKDVIDVIYQNRNCITHSGGCFKYVPEIDECKGPAYCKKSSFKIENLNRELSRMLKAYVEKKCGVKSIYLSKIPSD